jgi:hypothetical protein
MANANHPRAVASAQLIAAPAKKTNACSSVVNAVENHPICAGAVIDGNGDGRSTAQAPPADKTPERIAPNHTYSADPIRLISDGSARQDARPIPCWTTRQLSLRLVRRIGCIGSRRTEMLAALGQVRRAGATAISQMAIRAQQADTPQRKTRAVARVLMWCNRVLVNGSTTNSECRYTVPDLAMRSKKKILNLHLGFCRNSIRHIRP